MYTTLYISCIHNPVHFVYTQEFCVYTTLHSCIHKTCVYTKLYQTRPDQTRPVLSTCVDHDLPHDHGVWYVRPGGTTPRSKRPDP